MERQEEKIIRVSIGLKQKSLAKLKYLAAMTDHNESEVIVTGVELYLRMLEAEKNNSIVVVEDPSGGRVQIVLR